MKALLLSACILVSASMFAQVEDRYLEFGVIAGVVNYQGDLQEKLFSAAGSRPAFGGMLRYTLNQNFAVRGLVMIGNISSDDADNGDASKRARGYSFESSLFAGEAVVEYLPFGKERMRNGIFESQINPYVFAGVGFASADATVTTLNAADASLFPEADDQSTFFTVPLGAGVRYDIANGIAIGGEANWRATFSDYIDGVSVNGRADRDDWFWTFGGYVSFTLKGNDDSMNLR